MMDKNTYRGKRKDNGEWVYGYYVYQYGCHEIYLPECEGEYGFDHYAVIPETVGQCTGEPDAEDKMTFEHDTLEFDAYGRHYIGRVTYVEGSFAIICKDAAPFLYDAIKRHNAKIIGNIHDNPEILEEE